MFSKFIEKLSQVTIEMVESSIKNEIEDVCPYLTHEGRAQENIFSTLILNVLLGFNKDDSCGREPVRECLKICGYTKNMHTINLKHPGFYLCRY